MALNGKSSVLEKSSDEFQQSFKALNFTEYYYKYKAVFFTDEIEKLKEKKEENKYSIIFALERAKKVNVTAVCFKIFTDRPAKPLIYIYDYTNKSLNQSEEEFGKVHKEVWNTGEVPLIYIFTNTEVKIINCMKHPVKKEKELIPDYLDEPISIKKILEDSSEVSNIINKYSAGRILTGNFWEENENNFITDKTANEFLLKNLKEFRNRLLNQTEFKDNSKVVNRLLIQCILLKYLEERKDTNGNDVFPSGYFKKLDNAKDFCEVLQNGSFLNLCDDLEKKFNGKIFQWENDEDRKILKSLKLNEIANFLYAKQDASGQQWFWRLYSFNHLPVELISHIYDHILGENKEGKVYTPIHLANLLIDQSMPLDPDIKNIPDLDNYKLLDPSCGSGVFLVLAFKRLVQWWIIKNDWKLPDSDTIKFLLKNCLYGIDIDKEAVQLTVFSLSLALCDMLNPPEIWNNLRFEDLTVENIIKNDFFKYLKTQDAKFDLIIGNPPFKSISTSEDAKQIEDERKKTPNLPEAPDKQLAFLFMEQSSKLIKNDENSLLCLIIPALFLYGNANKYREYIFENNNVVQIIDFSHLSDILFSKANYPVLGIFIKNSKIINNDILHLVIKRTKIHKEKIYFEIDEYDFNYVERKTAIEDQYIWKCNFLGGGRIYQLIKYLHQERTFGEYLEKNNLWEVGVGYFVGNKSNKADYITGKTTVPTKYFTENGIEKKDVENNEYFEAPREKNLYEPPHLLIKCHIGKKVTIPVEFSNEYITFQREIIGIHVPLDDINELIKIEKRIKNNQTYRFYATCISNRSGIRKSFYVVTKQDIMNLPYPEDEKQLILSESEQTIVDDVLTYTIKSQSNAGENQLYREVEKEELTKFAKLFCDTLNSVYQDNEKQFRQNKIYKSSSFICNSFSYGDKDNNNLVEFEDINDLEKYLPGLIHNKIGESLLTTRIIRIYEKDIIYLIKPNQLRYWLGSIALSDADKTFADLLEDGH